MATIVLRNTKGSALTFQEGDDNFDNLNNDKIEYTDLSVGAEGTASGDGSIAYNNTTGVFTYTPPVIPSAVSDLTNDTGFITDYTVTEGDVTAHQAALSITESQISDLQSYLTSFTETDPIVGAITGIVKADGAGNISAAVAGTDYVATESFTELSDDTSPQLGGDLDLNSNDIDGTGNIDITGNVIAQSAINAQTGTTYTTVIGDASKLVTLSNASAITVTIPPNSSVAYPVGTKIDFAQIGAGQVTIAAGSGVTVNSTPTLKFRAQYSGATCIKTATNTWLLVGDLAES